MLCLWFGRCCYVLFVCCRVDCLLVCVLLFVVCDCLCYYLLFVVCRLRCVLLVVRCLFVGDRCVPFVVCSLFDVWLLVCCWFVVRSLLVRCVLLCVVCRVLRLMVDVLVFVGRVLLRVVCCCVQLFVFVVYCFLFLD